MAASLIEASEIMPVSCLSILIFGPPGSGKTSLCQTADEPLTLDLDRGAHRSAFRKRTMRFDAWPDLAEAKEQIDKCKALIPDTAGRLLDMLAADIIRTNAKHGSAVGGLSLQGFGALKARFAQWIGQLRLLGKDIVFIAHEKEERDGDERIMRPDIQGASYTELMKSCDLVGYLSLDGQGQRWLDFNPSDRHLGKNAAGWARMKVPDLGKEPHFLAGLIVDAKSKIGQISAASAEAAAKVGEWVKFMDGDPTVEAVHAKLPELGALKNGLKAQAWKVVTDKMTAAGYVWDWNGQTKTGSKKFVLKAEAA